MLRIKLQDNAFLEVILQELIERIMDENHLNDELFTRNPKYKEAAGIVNDIENQLEEKYGKDKLLIQYSNAVADMNTCYGESLFLKGIKTGFNLSRYAAGELETGKEWQTSETERQYGKN